MLGVGRSTDKVLSSYGIRTIGHGITTVQDPEDYAEVWNVILALIQDIGHKLRVNNKNAGGVAICIRYIAAKQRAGMQWQCQLSLRPPSAAIIAKEAFRLFE